jgi:hypothetical protein
MRLFVSLRRRGMVYQIIRLLLVIVKKERGRLWAGHLMGAQWFWQIQKQTGHGVSQRWRPRQGWSLNILEPSCRKGKNGFGLPAFVLVSSCLSMMLVYEVFF